MANKNQSNSVLLYDGLCGFCNQAVQRILRHDKRKTMLFAALQSSFGKSVICRHPALEGIDSLVFFVPGDQSNEERVFVRSDAVLKVARYLGGPWTLALAGYAIPRPVRDYLYDEFARRRYRWFGKIDSCRLPSPEERKRFLDVV